MPRPVYSEFGADEQQMPADEAVQGYIDQVYSLAIYYDYFFILKIDFFQLKDEIIAKTGPASALKAIHYYKRVHGAPIYYVFSILNYNIK